MRILSTIAFMVMVSCGTMEGDVNVDADDKELKTPTEQSPEETTKSEESNIEDENDNNTETSTEQAVPDEVAESTTDNGTDVNPDDSNSNNGGDHVEVNVEVNVNTDDDPEKNIFDEFSSPGKVSKGMTKSEVLAVLGDPVTIETDYWDRWIYTGYCAATRIYNDCFVEFENGRVDVVERFRTEFIDITSF